MGKIVGVRLKPGGKIYDFDCGAFVLNPEDRVVVETEHGLALGTVVYSPIPAEERQTDKPLRKIFRLASESDFLQQARNRETEKRAHAFCVSSIRQLGLHMNLFSVESTFEGNKLTFFFTSEGRVDFRQLVKTMVRELGVRIEMRQVGIRNQAKMCGGCGREVCCAAFIENFEPVSIRMAKEQSLSLNPTKISGLCGRLMCCLNYENATYQALKVDFPKIGKIVKTPSGEGKVIRHNVMCNRIGVRLVDGTETEFDLTKIEKEEKKE
jgi:cell fate regulator YaaT (PSP1 superfamily)